MSSPTTLSIPSASSLEQRLATLCQQRFVSFAEFMHMALYDPEAGYYSQKSHVFGAEGDFVTAPLISPFFGQAVSLQVIQMLENLIQQGYHDISLIEVAAGDGALTQSVITRLLQPETWIALQKACQDINHEPLIIHCHAVELSPIRRAQIDKKLSPLSSLITSMSKGLGTIHINISDTLPPSFTGIMIANELFDAIACEVVEWRDDGIYQLGVSSHNIENSIKFQWCDRRLDNLPESEHNSQSKRLLLQAQALPLHDSSRYPHPYRSEINLQAQSWLSEAISKMTAGYMLFFDYGFSAQEYYHPQRPQGTLKSLARHRLCDDVLSHIGRQDITACVNFSALAQVTQQHNAMLEGFAPISVFLVNNGIDQLVSHYFNAAQEGQNAQSVLERSQAMAGLRQLLDPNIMGETVKAFALSKGIKPAPIHGFSHNNQVARLI